MKQVKVTENFASIGTEADMAKVAEYLLLSKTYTVLKEDENSIWLVELGEEFQFDKRHFVESK